ncbi:hypothetical protein B0T19DRAFT_435048 [Cercophora scortea]|uniref:Uncharacterized protein n=1 Tax=Cercophora scortea TaxID=314031 RepID=A0AAE0I2N2_9PEZI|nr:hypothetical protein B0T19DRAFT_435048 [Cercophora scortea]
MGSDSVPLPVAFAGTAAEVFFKLAGGAGACLVGTAVFLLVAVPDFLTSLGAGASLGDGLAASSEDDPIVITSGGAFAVGLGFEVLGVAF